LVRRDLALITRPTKWLPRKGLEYEAEGGRAILFDVAFSRFIPPSFFFTMMNFYCNAVGHPAFPKQTGLLYFPVLFPDRTKSRGNKSCGQESSL
jgi:hypothetical protein